MILKLSHIHNDVYEFTYEPYVCHLYQKMKMLNETFRKIMSSKREHFFLISVYGIISDFLKNSPGTALYSAMEWNNRNICGLNKGKHL